MLTAPQPAPVLSNLKESARVWRAGNSLARISSRSRAKAPAVGTTFSFDLNEAASVTFAFSEPAGGRLVGRTCAPPSRTNARRRACVRTITAGTLTFPAHSTVNTVRFDGLISKRVRLRPGSYTLRVSASTAAGRAAEQAVRFTIAKG